jgi:hypothetical protein
MPKLRILLLVLSIGCFMNVMNAESALFFEAPQYATPRSPHSLTDGDFNRDGNATWSWQPITIL